ncbi:MAG: dienelactone hydrolase family protein [Alphaproteobacteria bacterium]|nr:dienelactone hydrolase family protein [Alphaproteobacteria bacterium]
MSDAGEMVRVASRDGFELGAFHVEPTGARKGGVIVVQEIFGISAHVRHMAERLGAAGFEALAPSMFDRSAPGFVSEPDRLAEDMPRARELAMGNSQDNAMNDIGACLNGMKSAGPVFVTGYCYGGTMSWVAAARLEGLAAASCYYGGAIPQLTNLTPKCPTICHFGRHDAHIPMQGVDALKVAHPGVEVHIYEAGHGFARKESSDYDAASDALAFRRTLELFGRFAV